MKSNLSYLSNSLVNFGERLQTTFFYAAVRRLCVQEKKWS